MSKERVLLKEFIDFVDSYEFYPTERNIIFEIVNRANAILAQPEQTEQEPVAWMWTRNYEGGGYTNKVFEFLNDAEEYAKDSKTLKSPDIIRPLYTAPPKHEPLSDEDVFRLYEESEYLGFLAYRKGIKDAEKAHGIGGE